MKKVYKIKLAGMGIFLIGVIMFLATLGGVKTGGFSIYDLGPVQMTFLAGIIMCVAGFFVLIGKKGVNVIKKIFSFLVDVGGNVPDQRA